MKYDSFYFLHIPKCDGRRFIDEIALPLKYNNPDLKMVSRLMGDYDGSGIGHFPHQGWDPGISDGTYIVSILRDPIERACSYYAFLSMEGIRNNTEYSNIHAAFFRKERFIDFVEKEDSIKNFSSKNFIYDIGQTTESRRVLYDNKTIESQAGIKLLNKRISRVNLLMDTETFASVDKDILFSKIQDDIGCPPRDRPAGDRKAVGEYTLKESSSLYESLDNFDKDYLRKYFEIDYSIYNDSSLFWKPNV